MHRQQGIVVNEEAIGTEVVNAVMRGGHFLAQEHTRNFMRRGEIFTAKLGNEAPYEEWRANGSVAIREQAKEKIAQLLAGHPGVLVSEAVSRELKTILEEARSERKNYG
jgi:trimethylamine:corrinoid methyltransferase-like protein